MPTYDISVSSLKERMQQNAAAKAMEEYTVLPAKVISTKDYVKHQCLSIEVLISDIYETKNQEDAGTIKLEKVFVRLPCFGGWQFRYPVSAGDPVMVYWSRKDLSQFLDGFGDKVSQNFNDLAGLEDCFVELGGGTRKNHNNPHLKNLEIEGPNTIMTITPDGNITTTTGGNITCTAGGTYDITASHLTIHNDTTITDNLLVQGNTVIDGTLGIGGATTSQGAVNALSGVFASTYAGVGGGAASFGVDMGINGTVTINGININTHTHNDSLGAPTTGPQ